MTSSIEEIEDTDVILITGSNTWKNHPIVRRMVKRAANRRRAKLIDEGFFMRCRIEVRRKILMRTTLSILSAVQIRHHYHTGTMTRRCRGLDLLVPEKQILLHPRDAERLGIESVDRVRGVSRRGAVEAHVEVSQDPQPGMIFATFHFGEMPINMLTNDALDPTLGIPEF